MAWTAEQLAFQGLFDQDVPRLGQEAWKRYRGLAARDLPGAGSARYEGLPASVMAASHT
jgi:hypothetical protein